MTTIINTNKINNIIFFNPKIIKDNSYKYRHYHNLSFNSQELDLEFFAILRVESSMTRSKKINGFATLKFYKSSKSMYIDVICTNTDIKGTGTYIINLLNKICKVLSLENIKLSSATQALPFYLKTDFECDPLCKMIKTVTGGNKTIRNKSNSRNKTFRMY